jgi:hypothetical protein
VLAGQDAVHVYPELGGSPASIPFAGGTTRAADVTRNGVALLSAVGGEPSAVYRTRLPDLTTLVPTSPSEPAPAPEPAPEPGPAPGPKTTTLKSVDFDSLPTGQLSAANFKATLGGNNNSEYDYDDSSIVTDNRGGKAYRLTLEAGTIRGNPSGNHGIVVFIPLAQQVTNACISYDVRFDGTFDWSLGGKLPGLQGTAPGVSPSLPTGGGNPGDKGWSGRMMWLTPKSYSWAGPTNMAVSYMYSPEMSSHYGDNIRWNKGFTAGTWHTVKQCYTMNTVGQANGKLHAWIDGTQVLALNNYVYRLRDDVAISHLNWSIFRGGATLDWAGTRTSHIDFDNVTITTVE